jgi:HAE1 family hydrophobic/amphiphilic exporter-1
MGVRVVDFIVNIVSAVTKNWMTRLAVISVLSILAIVSAVLLFPKMEYLPQGNRNLIISLLIPPPGLSFEERNNIGQQIYNMNKPYFGKDNGGYPGIKHMFYVGAEQIMLFGAISQHEQRAGELLPLFRQTINSIPGMFGISTQAGIFQTRLGRGRTVEVDISGDDT